MTYTPTGPNNRSNPYYQKRNNTKLAKCDYNRSEFFGTVGGVSPFPPLSPITRTSSILALWYNSAQYFENTVGKYRAFHTDATTVLNTLIDGDGIVKYPRHNLSQNSNDFSAWQKTLQDNGVAPIVTPLNAVAPDGTMTASTVKFETAGPSTFDRSRLRDTYGNVGMGKLMRQGIWVRGVTNSEPALELLIVYNTQVKLIQPTTTWQFFETEAEAPTTSTEPELRLTGALGAVGNYEIWHSQLIYADLLMQDNDTDLPQYNESAGVAYIGPRMNHTPEGERLGVLVEETDLITNNALNWYNPLGGTFFVEFFWHAGPAPDHTVFQLDDGTSLNVIDVHVASSGFMSILVRTANNIEGNLSAGIPVSGINRVAFSINGAGITASMNGAAITTSTVGVLSSALSVLRIGQSTSPTRALDESVARLEYYDAILRGEELIEMSTL